MAILCLLVSVVVFLVFAKRGMSSQGKIYTFLLIGFILTTGVFLLWPELAYTMLVSLYIILIIWRKKTAM